MSEALRFASATVYFFLVSGWLMLGAVFGLRKFRLLDTIALSFLTSLAAISLLAAGAHLLGLGLDAVLYSHVALSVACAVVLLARKANPGSIEDLTEAERRWEVAAAMLVAGAAGLAWVEGLWLRMSDLFYHIAGVASLLTNNLPLVVDPFFGGRNLPVDPTSGTFHTFLAAIARLAGTSAFEAFEWLEPVVVAVYLLSFYALARRVLDSAPRAFAALALFAGVVWTLDFRVVIYPKWLAPAIVWAGLVFFLMLLERFEWRTLLLTCLFAVTTALVHLSTAELWMFLIGAMLVWSLVLMRFVENGRRVALRCLAGGGLSIGALGPVIYRRSISVLVGAQTSVFNPPPNSPMSNLPFISFGGDLGIISGGLWHQGGDLMLAFTTAGLALLVVETIRRRGKAGLLVLTAGATIMPMLLYNVVATRLLVTEYWFHLRRLSYVLRFVPALMLPHVFAVARWELRDRAAHPSNRQKATVVLAIGAIVLGVAAFAWVETAGIFNRFINPASLDNFERGRHNVVVQMDGLARYLKTHVKPAEVVAADEKASYYLAALVPVRVIAVRRSHMPLAVEVRSGPTRREAQEAIFDPGVTAGDTRNLLDALKVSWIVAPAGSSAIRKFEEMRGLRRVYADRRYVAYSVDRPTEIHASIVRSHTPRSGSDLRRSSRALCYNLAELVSRATLGS